MNLPNATYTDYTYLSHKLIRYREVTYIDPETPGVSLTDFCFEIYKRPFFWGLVGKKQWEEVIQTNSYNMGVQFSASLIKRQLRARAEQEKRKNLRSI